jgi:hypothetical protein
MPTHNPIVPIDASYVGLFYAFSGLGGYIMEEGIKTITMLPVNQINQFDVTDSVQVKFNVATFNSKLGLIKDPSNIHIISTTFDTNTNTFPTDTITITSPDFQSGVNTLGEVISVGRLQYAYSDFIAYLDDYFNYPPGFSTLFTLSSQIDINNGVFDASAFLHVINEQQYNPSTGEYVNDLSGSVQVDYINQLLNYICYADPFNNRDPTLNITIQDGFIARDLVFVPDGVSMTLNLDIINNNIVLNNLGYNNVAYLNQTYNYTSGYFSVNTTVTNTNIKRVIKAPLLMVLVNE